MSCHDFEALLIDGEMPPELISHLAGCAGCRAIAEALELAQPAPLSPAESARLSALVGGVPEAYFRFRRQGFWRRLLSLSAAAALGGLVASAALLLRGRAAPAAEAADDWDLAEPAEELPELSFLEVGWADDFDSQGEAQ